MEIVQYMTNIKNVLPITPNTLHNVDASDFCWILFVYNSKEFVDEDATKGWDYDHTYKYNLTFSKLF